jgi:hypothetical protein
MHVQAAVRAGLQMAAARPCACCGGSSGTCTANGLAKAVGLFCGRQAAADAPAGAGGGLCCSSNACIASGRALAASPCAVCRASSSGLPALLLKAFCCLQVGSMVYQVSLSVGSMVYQLQPSVGTWSIRLHFFSW